MKHRVMYISFAWAYAVQFNTEDFYCGKQYKEKNYDKCHKKFSI